MVFLSGKKWQKAKKTKRIDELNVRLFHNKQCIQEYFKEIYMVTAEERIVRCLSKAYQWLFSLANYCGHWEEVRSTALVGISLNLREPINSAWLEHIKRWLLEKQKPVEGNSRGVDMGSWGEELWDTSMVLIALNHLGLSQENPQYKKALQWILNSYNKTKRNNWHDEPWETCWSILSILETDATSELQSIVYNATRWLLSLQNSEGKIVAPHYTAYLVMIGSNLLAYTPKLSQADQKEIQIAVSKASNYLLDTVSEQILWTGEPWSNGQILWALASTGKLPHSDQSFVSKVVNWFEKTQNKDTGSWEDVEDTASSILGLYHLWKRLEGTRVLASSLRERLSAELETPALCLKHKFIQNHNDGYTSINLSPKLKKETTILLTIASIGVLIISLWDFIANFFEKWF